MNERARRASGPYVRDAAPAGPATTPPARSLWAQAARLTLWGLAVALGTLVVLRWAADWLLHELGMP